MKKTSIFALLLVLAFAGSAQAASIPSRSNHEYETVAASQSDQALGVTGGAGDVLRRIIIVPNTTGGGDVSIKDGTGSSITLLKTGTLSDLKPIVIDMGEAKSTGGAWKVTTGSNVSVIAVGDFTF